MPIYELTKTSITEIKKTTFAAHGIQERKHLQNLLRHKIEVILKDTMVISEEFGDWSESRSRIDLLCLDKEANLIVVELKRTEDGGHMDLQAIRYSAMVSTMTFDNVVNAHQVYLDKLLAKQQTAEEREGESNDTESAKDRIVEFLKGGSADRGDDIDQEKFAQEVKIVLVSAKFSKELTTSAIWLNDSGVDIRLIKIEPYYDGTRILLDVQQVIPLPETADYQILVRQKKQQEQEARRLSKDYSKYALTVGQTVYRDLNKRNFMFNLVKAVLDKGITPEDISNLISWRKGVLFVSFEGTLNEGEFIKLIDQNSTGAKLSKSQRYFCKDHELYRRDGKTYALSNQWGLRTDETATKIMDKWKNLDISYEKQE